MKFDVTGYVTEEFILLEVEAESEEEARAEAIRLTEGGENHMLSYRNTRATVWNVNLSDE